ncbi:MAG: hypothetical protein RBT11_19125 [Desulfobacterales bacterium]|nr:hypothetical protein [Desulfobacterales bacterium]
MPKIERSIVNISAPVELSEAAEGSKSRRFSVLAYTGKQIDTWFGAFVIDIKGIKTKAKVPILRSHDHGKIVGWSEKTAKDDAGLSLSGVFSDSTDAGKEVLALADEGFPWQASVGVRPLQIRQLGAKETMEVNGKVLSGPNVEVWTKSLVGEVSVVPWGADNDTSIALLSAGDRVSVETTFYTEGGSDMDLKELKEKHPALYDEVFALGAASVDVNSARVEAASAERERVTAILSENADSTATLQAIKDGTSVDGAFKLFYKAEKERKTAELAALAASGNNAIGHQTPATPAPVITDPAAEVSRQALALSVKEKISLADATTRILTEDKTLADKYWSQFTV